jgi:hypothetical protein
LDHTTGAELSEDELLYGFREAGLITYPSPLLGRLLGILPVQLFELLVILPWWALVRLQGPSPPHRLRARLSAALAEELVGPYLPNTKYPVQLTPKDSLADQLQLS